MIKKIDEFIENTLRGKDFIFLPVIALIFAILRLPSVIEPYWYGDEGIYEVIGVAMREGRILYSQIWDNKPPLLYVIYAIFAGEQFYVRLASLVVGFASVIVFFFTAKKLFKSSFASYVSTSIFAISFAIPVMEGNIANAENFMILPTLIAFFLLFCTKNKKNFILIAIAGFMLSLSFLTKIVGIFDLAAFSLSLFVLRFFDEISFKKKEITEEIKKVITSIEQETVLLIAFVTPIIFTILYFLAVNAFPDFMRAAFSQNVGYVAYGNFFIIENGLLYLKLFILIVFVALIVRYRRNLGTTGVVIFLWMIFSIFNALFSARPYTHYILVTLPSVALFIGFVIENKKLAKITIPLLLIAILILLNVFKLNFRKTIPYYVNYAGYVLGINSNIKYQSFFDDTTPRDYKIADFIRANTMKDESVFIWGDSAQIYKLSGKLPPGRYTVSYHITFYPDAIDETKRAFQKNPPKYIIQIKSGDILERFLDGYELRYKFDDTKIYEKQS